MLMPNPWFNFKQFKVWQRDSAFKVGTDGVLLGAWCRVENDRRIMDIGTGTGLIALMAAQRSQAEITAIEPDRLSAAEATVNIARSPWHNRIKVIETSLQEYSASTGRIFDHIITNPPFFKDSLPNPDSRLSGARHNHNLLSSELLTAVRGLLSESGRFSLVLPYAEANLFIAEASGYGFYCSRLLNVKPLPGKPVKRILMEFVQARVPCSSGFLIIEKGERHDYTQEYRSLTRDFYLDF